MRKIHVSLSFWIVWTILLTACGHQDDTPITHYTVGGVIQGLAPAQRVSLVNNGSDTLIIQANGRFVFNEKLKKMPVTR